MRRWLVDRASFFEDRALNLAVFRVVVGALLLWLPDFHYADRYAALPAQVLTPPVGLSWLSFSPETVTPLYWVAIVAVGLGTVGLFTRLAWGVAAVTLLYVLAVPQFVGSVFHYHHLYWFAALLAASPSGDALSVDAWLAARRGETLDRGPCVAYGLPIRAAWALVGVVFFFPGLHKLLTSGGDWIFSDNLRNHMYAKWTQMAGFEPLFRVDRHPWLVRLGALSVVAMELCFGVLVMSRRGRWLAVGAALVFHQLTAYFMGIHFEALWITYVVFVDWAALARRAGLSKRPAPARTVEVNLRSGAAEAADEIEASPGEAVDVPARRAVRPGSARGFSGPAIVVATVLLGGNVVFGVGGVSDGWPFACYPKFDRALATTRLPALEVEVVSADGVGEVVPVRAMSAGGATQRWWALTWSLLGAHERARADPRRFRAFWNEMARRPEVARRAQGATAVRFYRATVSTVPEERGETLARTLVCELPLSR